MRTLAKGNEWRHRVATLLAGLGEITKRGIGQAGDDLTLRLGWVTLSIEAKNHRTMELGRWIDQAVRQAGPGEIPVVVAHRIGRAGAGDGFAVLRGSDFAELLRRAER